MSVYRENKRLNSLLCVMLVLYSGILGAESKPVAPENIANAKILVAEEVIELILARPNMIIIDSRKKSEYLKGHIEGAVNILNTDMVMDDLNKLAPDKSRAILFYCNGVRCMRSSDAASKAVAWGYTNIFWFRGGWDEWIEKRLPVVTDEK